MVKFFRDFLNMTLLLFLQVNFPRVNPLRPNIFLEQTPIAKGSFVGLTFLIHLQSFSDNIFSALFLISDTFFGTDKL